MSKPEFEFGDLVRTSIDIAAYGSYKTPETPILGIIVGAQWKFGEKQHWYKIHFSNGLEYSMLEKDLENPLKK